MIERHHLAILFEIKSSGSLTAAAKKLHLTQSALSHTIKKLEQKSNVNLWQKQGRSIRLTQAGEYLLSVANILLPQLEKADQMIYNFANGVRGLIRIGMECHPCYKWLLKVVEPYIKENPNVDIDIKQNFQFGGLQALLNYDIDVLVTPDPINQKNITFKAVFDYQQVLVVSSKHHLAEKKQIQPEDLINETLYSYPVDINRLDIYTKFLNLANCIPKEHKNIENNDIIMQLVAAGKGVSALPNWLVEQYYQEMNIKSLKFGKDGINKSIHIGIRNEDRDIEYIKSFVKKSSII